jgi:glutathione S-transferase
MRNNRAIMLTLYDFEDSGNGYKVRLALAQLDLPYRLVPIDILKGESRTPAFLAKNPNGRIPLLELPDGSTLPESNAILAYVARDSHLVPKDPFAHAQALSWMFFEQYSHEPYVATSRFILRHLPPSDRTRDELARRLPKAREALSVMEQHLARTPFFVEARYGIADITLYAYTHRAEEASIDLACYPAIRAWIARVEAEPGWIPMLRA